MIFTNNCPSFGPELEPGMVAGAMKGRRRGEEWEKGKRRDCEGSSRRAVHDSILCLASSPRPPQI